MIVNILAAVPATGDNFPAKGLLIGVGAAVVIAVVSALIASKKNDDDDEDDEDE